MLRLVTILLLIGSVAGAQPVRPFELPAGVQGKAWIVESQFAPFPDSLRNAQPRVYEGKTYEAAAHYSDSSVLVFVPDYFDKHKAYEFVCWFHGWYNNIDSSVKSFRLLEQFYSARRNAVFIFPEGPKNAPDSYGGKLEQRQMFRSLENEVKQMLVRRRILPNNDIDPMLTLCGHSGAYRVIGKAVSNHPSQILLFDGLYGELENYLRFCANNNRLLHIYTDNGGTKDNSIQFLKLLDEKGIAYLHKEEDEVTDEELTNNRIIFLHSKKGHNEVITNNNNFERFLRNFR